ncbi:MAG: type I phosphomannose isomerase catalytic subunit [Opitutales bacterium]
MTLLEFKPLYQERIWGNRGLETKLGRSLPSGKQIGESWEIVDRTDAQSVVAVGPETGKTLRTLLESAGQEILGPSADPTAPFPILVKWLDCQDRLSLQVHPPAAIAPELGGEPKTENWYIADAEPGAALLAGLKSGVTREQFTRALQENQAEACVHRFPVEPGDSLLVESGRMHAIDGGNLILEIQQNSDTTYRVYDWGRVGLDGRPRELHLEASLRSINFEDFEPSPRKAQSGRQTLADCAEFRIRKFELNADEPPLELPDSEEPRLLHVVSGAVMDSVSGRTLEYGKNYLQPYVTPCKLSAAQPATLLVTDRFV